MIASNPIAVTICTIATTYPDWMIGSRFSICERRTGNKSPSIRARRQAFHHERSKKP
jgi:hypothetical protein